MKVNARFLYPVSNRNLPYRTYSTRGKTAYSKRARNCPDYVD